MLKAKSLTTGLNDTVSTCETAQILLISEKPEVRVGLSYTALLMNLDPLVELNVLGAIGHATC